MDEHEDKEELEEETESLKVKKRPNKKQKDDIDFFSSGHNFTGFNESLEKYIPKKLTGKEKKKARASVEAYLDEELANKYAMILKQLTLCADS